MSRQAINSNTDATHKSIQIFTSGALSADAARELNVLGKYGHPFAMDGDKVSILKEASKIPLRGLLQRGASEPGEAKAAGKVLADFPHDTMEGSLADQEVRRPLVLSDFAQRDGAYAEPVRPSQADSERRKAANGPPAGGASS